jgi:hypothetical protein
MRAHGGVWPHRRVSDVTERHPAGYPWRKRFPGARAVVLLEGGAIFAAEAEGAFWIITDEGTMATFLDEEDAALAQILVKLQRFEQRSAWETAIEEIEARFPPIHSELARKWNDERAKGT